MITEYNVFLMTNIINRNTEWVGESAFKERRIDGKIPDFWLRESFL